MENIRTSRKSRLGILSFSLYSGYNLSLGKTPVIDIHELNQLTTFIDFWIFEKNTNSTFIVFLLLFLPPSPI